MNLINEAVLNISITMSIREAGYRVWSVHRDYLRTLRSAGYDTIPEARPHIALKYIHNRLKLQYFRTRMDDITLWRKNKQFDKPDFNALMRMVVTHSKQFNQKEDC